MSSEFDSGGFSAVSTFFGAQDSVEDNSKDSKPVPSSRKRNRLGLGAKETQLSNNFDSLESVETRKKILSIGKKKQNDLSDDDSVEDINQSDDEGGRTSIKKKIQTPSIDAATLYQSKKSKKKKKKGKKERLAERQKEEVSDQAQNEVGLHSKNEANDTPEQKADNSEGELVPSSTNGGSKRKKPKVRSRQKNIKKDNRPSNEKPDHLRVGSKHYAGRPMTKETRQFLALPESRTVSRAKNKHQRFDEVEKNNFDEGGLAIDDLLAESPVAEKEETTDSGELVNKGTNMKESEEPPKKRRKGEKKKKKSKFKNLK